MKYIMFDLYVSDVSLIEGKVFDFEISSSGKNDVEERCWRMTLGELKGSALENGWNHFAIDLSTNNRKDGVFDATGWDFLRLYNKDEIDAGDGLTIALKNIGFSAISPEAEAAKAEAEEIAALYATIADIRKGDVNADNYETVMQTLTTASDAYVNTTDAVRAFVDEILDTAAIERAVIKALEQYEKELNTPAEPVDPPVTEGPTTETPSTQPSTTAPATTTEAPATTTAAATTTAKATTKAATTAATTAAETEADTKGCKGSIAISALVLVPTLAGGALLLKRRKED
jgi:hypothetical protein